MSVITNHMAT